MVSDRETTVGALCPTCGEGRYDEDGFCSDAFHVSPWTEACGCVRKPGRWGSHLVTACKEHENLLRKPTMTDHREAPAPTLGELIERLRGVRPRRIEPLPGSAERAPYCHDCGWEWPTHSPRCKSALCEEAARALAERAEPDGALREDLERELSEQVEFVRSVWPGDTPYAQGWAAALGYLVEYRKSCAMARARRGLASAPQRAGTEGDAGERELSCPFCGHAWKTLNGPEDYAHCPSCRGSYSFRTPRVS